MKYLGQYNKIFATIVDVTTRGKTIPEMRERKRETETERESLRLNNNNECQRLCSALITILKS